MTECWHDAHLSHVGMTSHTAVTLSCGLPICDVWEGAMRNGRLARAVAVSWVAMMMSTPALADVPPRTDSDGSRFAGETSVGVALDELGSGPSSGKVDEARLAKEAQSPGNKRARDRDRTAFADQGRDEALETLTDAFPEIVNAPPWRPLELGDGDRLIGYTSAYTAKVDAEDGGTVIVDSQLPLRARQDGAGALRPLSYDMQSGSKSFQLENPLVPLVIHKDLDDGIALPDQRFSVRPSGADSTSPPMLVGDKVLYANLVTDTDLFVVPTPTGMETILSVRSKNAPSSSALQVTLGAGQSIEPILTPPNAEPGGYRIVDAAGAQFAQIPLPIGFDAAGRNVPVSMTLEDDKLVLRYPHDDPSLQFPLAIDPVLDAYGIDPNSGSRVNDYDPFLYWDYWANDYYDGSLRKGADSQAVNPNYATAFASIRGQSGYGNGLYVLARAQNQYFRSTAVGEWIWPAPGKSFIRRADFGYVTNAPQATCVIEGIWAPSRGTWDTGTWNHPAGQTVGSGPSPFTRYSPYDSRASNANACSAWTNNYKAHSVDNPTPGNQVVFGMQGLSDGNRAVQPLAYMYGASMWLDDADNPSLAAPTLVYQLPGGPIQSGVPTGNNGWVAKATFGVRADISDPGLGAKKIDLLSDGVLKGTASNPCTGGKDYRCPSLWPASQTNQQYTSEQLGDGAHSMKINGADAVGHRSNDQTWTVKIDSTAPALSLTGSMKDADGSTIAEGGTLSLGIHADDAARSGISRVDMTFDGDAPLDVTLKLNTGLCVLAACPDTFDAVYSVNADALSIGKHTAVVTTTDLVGNSGPSQTVSFTVQEKTYPAVATTYDPADDLTGDDSPAMDDTADFGPLYAECVPDDTESCDGYDTRVTATRAAAGRARSPRALVPAGLNADLSPGGTGWGLATELPGNIEEPGYRELAPKRVRKIVPWDVALRPFKDTACSKFAEDRGTTERKDYALTQYQRAKDWVRKAKADQSQIVISFGKCANGFKKNAYPSEAGVLPTTTEYKEAIRRFLGNRNFKGVVTEFTSWNEPNSKGQPTSAAKSGSITKGATAAAQYWMVFRDLCKGPTSATPKCVVAAGEFVDDDQFSSGAYYRVYRKAITGVMPTVWAFHPYVAASSPIIARFDRFLAGVLMGPARKPSVWITEAGGIRSSDTFPYDGRTEADATTAARKLLTTVAGRSPQITRLYYYSLHGTFVEPGTGGKGFDSGLYKPTRPGSGTPETKRPQFDDVKAQLNPATSGK